MFVALPTGYGKSLCYALLPIVFDFVRGRPLNSSIVLCVSPLISLMVDQKEQYSKSKLYKQEYCKQELAVQQALLPPVQASGFFPEKKSMASCRCS